MSNAQFSIPSNDTVLGGGTSGSGIMPRKIVTYVQESVFHAQSKLTIKVDGTAHSVGIGS